MICSPFKGIGRKRVDSWRLSPCVLYMYRFITNGLALRALFDLTASKRIFGVIPPELRRASEGGHARPCFRHSSTSSAQKKDSRVVVRPHLSVRMCQSRTSQQVGACLLSRFGVLMCEHNSTRKAYPSPANNIAARLNGTRLGLPSESTTKLFAQLNMASSLALVQNICTYSMSGLALRRDTT